MADGVFTVPRDGVYHYTWNSVTAGAHFCHLHLYKNGADVGFTAYSDGRSKHIDSSSMSVVLGLMTGDRLWVHMAVSSHHSLDIRFDGEAMTVQWKIHVTCLTPYNRIKNSVRIRHIRHGQGDGLYRIKFVIYGTLF